VIDNNGAFGKAYSTVTVGNITPTADAGGPYSVYRGSRVTLDASGSTSPGHAIVSYLWDLDGDGQYDDAFSATVVIEAADVGVFALAVRVIDDGGRVDDDDAQLTVLATTLGDANGDRVVYDLDASILASNWHKHGNWCRGDFNGDGWIDEMDASILASHWSRPIEMTAMIDAEMLARSQALEETRLTGPRAASSIAAVRQRIEPCLSTKTMTSVLVETQPSKTAEACDIVLAAELDEASLAFWSYEYPEFRDRESTGKRAATDLETLDEVLAAQGL